MKRISRTANNEILKSMSTYMRTASLGLLAVAIIEPLRNASAPPALPFATALIGSIVTFLLSLLILTPPKDEER